MERCFLVITIFAMNEVYTTFKVYASGIVNNFVQNRGMTKKGFKPNIEPEAYVWMRTEQSEQGCTKSVIVTAALMALRATSPEERKIHVQWAYALDEGQITWKEFEDVAGATLKARGKALLELADQAIRREITKEGGALQGPA